MQYKSFFQVVTFLIAISVISLSGFSLKNLAHEPSLLPLEIELVLRCEYVDGEISEEILTETVSTYEDFWLHYAEWEFIDIENEKIVLQRKVDDISPLLKTNGYFGVTEDGILTIFNGKPDQSDVIHSFFQIDIRKLESRIKTELLNGIPVKSKDHYVEVLETFKPYTK